MGCSEHEHYIAHLGSARRNCTFLEKFANCNHAGLQSSSPHSPQPNYTNWSCDNCDMHLSGVMVKLRNVNPILCRYGRDVLRIGRLTLPFARHITGKIGGVLRLHVAHARELEDVHDLTSPDSIQFRKDFGRFNIPPLHNRELKDEVVGASFPGRRQYRPFVTFDSKDTHFCNKEYPSTGAHTPGLQTLQCAWASPKLIGFYVMDRPESSSLAL